MKPKNKTVQHLGLIALAFAGVSSPLAQAASQTWTNSASDLLWNTSSLDWTGAAWTNNNDAVFGATGVGSIAVASGVIVNDIAFNTAGYTLTGNLMLANDQASTFTATQNATISAIIANNTAGASSLTKAGANTLTLSGANTYSGGTTLNAGTVSVGNDAAFGTGAVTIAGASTVTNSTAVTLANNFTTTALPTFTSSGGTMVLNGNITGGQGVTLNATNKITLAGTNSFGTSSAVNGVLQVNAGAGGVDITGSTTVGTGTSAAFGGTLVLAGTTTLTVQSGGSLSIVGSTNATPPPSIIGQNLAGTSTVVVNGGTLTIGANSGFILGNQAAGAIGVLTISSGTATINRGTTGTATTTETRLIVMGKDNATASGTINLNGGTLATDRQFVRDGSSSAGSGTANFVFGGGTLKALGAQTDWLQSATATSGGQGGGTVNASALALSSVTTTAVSTIDANSYSVAINSAISGAGGFTITDSTATTGKVTLGGTSSYTGATKISSGILNVATLANFNTNSSIGKGSASNTASDLVLDGGTLQYTGTAAASTNRLYTLTTNGGGFDASGTTLGTMTVSGNMTASGATGSQTLTLKGSGTGATGGGTLSGTINNGTGTNVTALTKSGAGSWIVSGANTYTGATAVNTGTLKAGVASVANTSGAFGNNSAVTMANVAGATLDITGFNTQIGSLTGGGVTGGNVVLGAATLTTGGDNTSPAAYAGVISGTGGALTKIGTGTLTLTGTNTYTGNTTVDAGKLVVNGSCSTSTLTTVNTTATLGGSGTIGALVVMSGGTVAPGNSPGILSAGNTDLQAGSTLSMDINGSALGTGYDQLNITGTVSLANALSLNLGGYTPVNSTLFFILANDSTDAITGTFSNAPIDGSTYTLGGKQFQISYFGDSTGGTFTGGNDVVLMAVPEPGAALLGGLGVLALLRRRRVD